MNFNPRLDEIFKSLERGISSDRIPTTYLASAPSSLLDRFATLQASLGSVETDASGQIKRGRPTLVGIGETPVRRHRARKKADRERCVAVLDTETDPFDPVTQAVVFPFLAVLYSDQFDPVVIWEENHKRMIERILEEIAKLPEPYTIYAHNGGKFDYMFFINELRGAVSFKGRGIMRAQLPGRDGIVHEIRDSMHIIPTSLLSAAGKMKFDYSNMLKSKREKQRKNIIEYCIDDCRRLLKVIRKFVERNSLKLSIGQAALAGVKQEYKFECLNELTDAKLRGVHFDTRERDLYGKPTGRGYFYGGRVDCFAGRGVFTGPLYYVDVNSMYPAVMANCKHPVGSHYTFRSGIPDNYTAFVRVQCRNNGALIARNENGETTSQIREGEFFTTIWEFEAACDLELISNVRIIQCVDCNEFTDFSRFVLPRYEYRAVAKAQLAELEARGITDKSNDFTYDDISLTNTVMKFELNNAYGKFAQNPRRYREHCFTDIDAKPDDGFDWGVAPKFISDVQNYAIWERKAYKWDDNEARYIWDRPPRFYNVGTGASITGAARSVLLRALHRTRQPIYCDTDSIICRDVGDLEIDTKKLGAWKLEKVFDEVVIAGKKEYACKVAGLPDGHKDRIIVKSKGVDGVTYAEMVRLASGEKITKTLKAPTMDRYGGYKYLTREIGPTVPVMEDHYAVTA